MRKYTVIIFLFLSSICASNAQNKFMINDFAYKFNSPDFFVQSEEFNTIIVCCTTNDDDTVYVRNYQNGKVASEYIKYDTYYISKKSYLYFSDSIVVNDNYYYDGEYYMKQEMYNDKGLIKKEKHIYPDAFPIICYEYNLHDSLIAVYRCSNNRITKLTQLNYDLNKRRKKLINFYYDKCKKDSIVTEYFYNQKGDISRQRMYASPTLKRNPQNYDMPMHNYSQEYAYDSLSRIIWMKKNSNNGNSKCNVFYNHFGIQVIDSTSNDVVKKAFHFNRSLTSTVNIGEDYIEVLSFVSKKSKQIKSIDLLKLSEYNNSEFIRYTFKYE